MSGMRICSFLPSATEILYGLGLGESVVGVSYECDNPPDARNKPVVVHTRLPETKDSGEMDRLVKDYLARGESLYRVDDELLAELAPDLIVTQDLCQVCAASPDDLPTALSRLPKEPRVVTLSPKTMQEVWVDILTVGEAARRLGLAGDLVAEIRQRLRRVADAVAGVEQRPRVLCLEWLNPPFVGGHWVPDMVAHAGGEDVLGKPGQPSFEVSWEQVVESRPDVIVVCPCGYSTEEAAQEFKATKFPPGWSGLPAVRAGQVFAVNANHYFSRPSQGVATGVELLAGLLHPGRVSTPLPSGSVAPLS